MMSDLEFEFATRGPAKQLNFNVIEATLNQSRGVPTMSDEDVKLTILNLIQLAKHQEKLILTLMNHVDHLERKKTFFQKLFRK